ncbi:MAG: lipid-A-disaccharide synthase [Bacteroidia bacterium]|nr:lipid-A-disaccharide synthase [Bacteroidia bacterium]MDW8058073.1 lipid-A-disaccharide synthase [Bacteroidia bacterium]
MNELRLYWVVGELSGEKHAADVIRALYQRCPSLRSRGMGGDEMAQLGMELLAHWQNYAVVGFIEVLRNLPRFLRLYRRLKKDISAYKPHRLILVDYPGLNLRLLRWALRQGIPVTYFIPPQLWAWNPGRVRHLRHPLVQVLCILPFEPEFYARYGITATYVGHPLVERLKNVAPFSWERPYIALLPGSRVHEVKNMLPVMAQLKDYFPDMDFLVSRVTHIPATIYERFAPGIPLIEGQTHSLLKGAVAAVVTSGTATLEAALLGTPSVIVYKGNPISYYIAKRLVRVSFIGLPNLILGEPVFPELIQGQYTPPRVAAALREVMERASEIQLKLKQLYQAFGEYAAAERVAELLLSSTTQKE